MSSKDFNIQVVKDAVQGLYAALARMERGAEYDIAPEASEIISQCIEDLENLLCCSG